MIDETRKLSPYSQKIAEEIALSEIEEFGNIFTRFKEHSNQIYEKYRLMNEEIKKEQLEEFKDKICLTRGDEDLYFVLERAAFRMMSLELNLSEIWHTYSNICDRIAQFSRMETTDNKQDGGVKYEFH